MEQRTSLLQPGIARSEMEKIVCTDAKRKTKEVDDRKLAAVVPTVATPLPDPHALTVGGVFRQPQQLHGGAGPHQQQQRQYGGPSDQRQNSLGGEQQQRGDGGSSYP